MKHVIVEIDLAELATRKGAAEQIATMNGYMRVIRRVADDESYADSASVIESRLMSIRNLASIALREARS